MSTLVLYGAWRSTCTHRVILALKHLGLPFQYIAVDLDKREQESPAFLEINPASQVPVLVSGDLKLSQSLAIVVYLDAIAATGATSLFPDSAVERARSLEIAERVSSFIQPFILPGGVRRRLVREIADQKDAKETEQALGRFVVDQMMDSLGKLDRKIAETAGDFCVGNKVTVADIFVFPQLVGAARLGIDVNGFPTLARIYEKCLALPSFKEADPNKLPDAPSAAAGAQSHNNTRGPELPLQPDPNVESGTSRAAALSYKEPSGSLSHYLGEVINKPLPQLQYARSEAFQRFGPVATKVSALEVCFFLRWIAQATGARKAIEIGVFTGSSSLAILDGMGPDGHLDAFDISPEYTDVAVEAWRRAGFEGRVTLHLVDAVQGLQAMNSQPGASSGYDLAYIDASNTQYQAYYEAILPLMQQGGVIVFDNVLWKGRVAGGDMSDPSSVHLRELNAALRHDRRVENTIISLGDGLSLSVVK
jgi:maleylacetoacetate isomerase